MAKDMTNFTKRLKPSKSLKCPSIRYVRKTLTFSNSPSPTLYLIHFVNLYTSA